MYVNKAKKALALILAGTLVFGMVGCSKPAAPAEAPAAPVEEKVTLKIYAQYSDDDTKVPYDYAVKKLAEKYPNVTLELDIQAQDDGQKLQSYAATGNLPDIFQVNSGQIEMFKKSNNIMVLDDFVKSTGFDAKLQPGGENLLYNTDGHAYAFPYAGNELVMIYYNKALFAKYGVKVPETYEDLEAAIATFKKNDIVPLSIFAKEKWITTALYDVFATRFDAGGIKKLDAGQGSAKDQPYVDAAAKLHDMVKKGLLADGATNMNYDQAAALFYEGKAAMFINGQWEIQASTDKLGDDVDWMLYPGNPENKYAFSGGGAAAGYAINPNSPNKEIAAEVAAYISEMYCEAKYVYRANPILALKVDPALTPEKPYPPMMEKLSKEIPNIKSYTAFSWGLQNPDFKTLVEDQSQFLLTPDYSADEFTTEMDKGISRIFKK